MLIKNSLNNFACFVISSDKTSDILEHSIISYKKNFKIKYPIFIGTNGNLIYKKHLNAIPLFSIKSNWKNETTNQILQLKNKNKKIKKILILLDDFIIYDPVNVKKLKSYFNWCQKKNTKYLSLRSLKMSFVEHFILKLRRKIFLINKDYPYYHSLQAAIWDIDYFLNCLRKCNSIWNFEIMKSSKNHYCVSETLIKYMHIVEKGKWIFYARSFCLKHINFFKPGVRQINNDVFFILKYYFTRIINLFFGTILFSKNKNK